MLQCDDSWESAYILDCVRTELTTSKSGKGSIHTQLDIDIKVYNYALCAVYFYCDLFILFPWPLMLV